MNRFLSKARVVTSAVLQGIAVLSLLLLLLVVLWGVISRYALGSQSPWTEELARMLLVWVTMLGGALGFGQHAHLAIDLVVIKLHESARWVADILSHFACGFFAAYVMLWGGGKLTMERFEAEQILPALQISRGWVYLSVPVAGGIITWYALGMMLESASAKSDSPISERNEVLDI